jgi:hypothetical protein
VVAEPSHRYRTTCHAIWPNVCSKYLSPHDSPRPRQASPMIDQFDIVKGRLGEHFSHWITSRARLSQPENLRRGARSKALVLSRTFSCAPHRDTMDCSREICRSTHWAVNIEWRYEAISGGNLWLKGSWFSFMAVRTARRLMHSFWILISEFLYIFFEFAVLGTRNTRLSIQNQAIRPGRRTFRAAILIAPWIKLENINYNIFFFTVKSTYRKICVGVNS